MIDSELIKKAEGTMDAIMAALKKYKPELVGGGVGAAGGGLGSYLATGDVSPLATLLGGTAGAGAGHAYKNRDAIQQSVEDYIQQLAENNPEITQELKDTVEAGKGQVNRQIERGKDEVKGIVGAVKGKGQEFEGGVKDKIHKTIRGVRDTIDPEAASKRQLSELRPEDQEKRLQLARDAVDAMGQQSELDLQESEGLLGTAERSVGEQVGKATDKVEDITSGIGGWLRGTKDDVTGGARSIQDLLLGTGKLGL